MRHSEIIFVLLLCFASSVFSSCNNDNGNNNVVKKDANAVVSKDSSVAINKKIIAEADTTTISINTDTGSFHLTPHHIVLQKGIELDLNIPEGYNICIAAEGLRRLRFLSKSPDGKLFATDMFDKSDNKKGCVYIFSSWDDSTRQF